MGRKTLYNIICLLCFLCMLPLKNLAQCNQQVGDNTYYVFYEADLDSGPFFDTTSFHFQGIFVSEMNNVSEINKYSCFINSDYGIIDTTSSHRLSFFHKFNSGFYTLSRCSWGYEGVADCLHTSKSYDLPSSWDAIGVYEANHSVVVSKVHDLQLIDDNKVESLKLKSFRFPIYYLPTLDLQVVWEYSLDENLWKEITNNKSERSEELLINNIDLEVDLYRPVFFRYKLPVHNGNNVKVGCIVSSSVPYIFIPPSPKLVGSPSLSHPLCSEDTNGGVTFNFDRELAEGEVMNLQLWRVTPEGDIGQDGAVANVPNTSMNGRSYQWPREIPLGTYYLVYSAKASGSSIFSSAEKSSNFTITAPAPLTLEMVSKKDINCQGGSDGSITIQITGGTPPYQYQVGGGVWSTPSSSSQQMVTGLSAVTHTVRVRDKNGCTPQE